MLTIVAASKRFPSTPQMLIQGLTLDLSAAVMISSNRRQRYKLIFLKVLVIVIFKFLHVKRMFFNRKERRKYLNWK